MLMEMIMPPPPPVLPIATQLVDVPDFRDTDNSSESMSPQCPQKSVQESECAKEGENAIQKLLAESTAAIAELTLSAAADIDPTATAIGHNQEDAVVSSPPMTTDNVVQQPPR